MSLQYKVATVQFEPTLAEKERNIESLLRCASRPHRPAPS